MIVKSLIGLFALSSMVGFTVNPMNVSSVDWNNRIYMNASDYFSGGSPAFENVQVNDSKQYNGIVLSSTKVFEAEYTKQIDISDNTKNDVLLEFITMPDVVGVYDYRVVNFTFYEIGNENNYFTARYQYDGNSGTIDILRVAGSNQDLYGRKYIRNNDEFDFTGIAQNMVGQSATKQPYESLKFYYDKSENAFYCSTVYGYSDASSKQRVIRDFDDDLNLKLYNGSTVAQQAWTGFTSNKIGLKISVSNIAGGATARIGILNIDGQYIANRVDTVSPSKGLIDYTYPIPIPNVFSPETNSFVDYLSTEHEVRVFDEGGNIFNVVADSFTPTHEGKYTIKYAVVQYGKTYGFDLDVEIIEETTDLRIDYVNCPIYEGMSLFKGNELDVDIQAVSDLHINGTTCNVRTDVYYNSQLIDSFTNKDHYTFVANNYGNYKFMISATDYIGRTVEDVINFVVSRTFIDFVDPNTSYVVVDLSSGVLGFNKDDIIVKDVVGDVVVESKNFTEYVLRLYCKAVDGEYEPFNSPKMFTEIGVYYIKYEVLYKIPGDVTQYQASIVKTVDVVDITPPVFNGTNVIVGAKANTRKTDLGASWYKAITNTEITINKESAYDVTSSGRKTLSNITTTLLIPGEESVDISSNVEQGYKLSLTKLGVYYISYSVSDEYNTTSKIYAVEVKTEWLDVTFNFVEPDEGIVGKLYNFSLPIVTNFQGEPETDYILEIYLSNDVTTFKVDGTSFTPSSRGTFNLTYVIRKNDETLSYEFKLVIVDKTAPLIILGNYSTVGYVGYTYVLPSITVVDNCDINLGCEVFLVHKGVSTQITGTSFVPTEVGEYTIVFSTRDLSGNSANKQYKIEVKDNKPAPSKGGCGGSIAATSALLSVVSLSLLTTILIKKRKLRK